MNQRIRVVDDEGGIAAAAAVRPGLIPLDLRLPRMNGFQTWCARRADPGTVKLPIVTLTPKALPAAARALFVPA